MPNPYEILGSAALPTLAINLAAAVVLMGWLRSNGEPLKTEAAPRRIISFELCWTAERSMNIVKQWREIDEIPRARQNILADFFFIPAYAITLCLIYGWLATHFDGKGILVTCLIALAWLQFLAGALDVVENLCMLKVLDQQQLSSSFLPRFACICASVKFILTGVFAGLPIWVAMNEGF